jgi:hypothetical protein
MAWENYFDMTVITAEPLYLDMWNVYNEESTNTASSRQYDKHSTCRCFSTREIAPTHAAMIAPNKLPYCHIMCKPYKLLYWKLYSDVLLNICGGIEKRAAENINEQIQKYFHSSAFIFHLLETSRRLGLLSSVRSVVLETYLQDVRVDVKLTLPNLSESCTVLCQPRLLLIGLLVSYSCTSPLDVTF